jgi:hypothetical protein
MSKLNLDDVLFMCFGRADRVESRRSDPDSEKFRDAVVLTDDIEPRTPEAPIEPALEVSDDEVR